MLYCGKISILVFWVISNLGRINIIFCRIKIVIVDLRSCCLIFIIGLFPPDKSVQSSSTQPPQCRCLCVSLSLEKCLAAGWEWATVRLSRCYLAHTTAARPPVDGAGASRLSVHLDGSEHAVPGCSPLYLSVWYQTLDVIHVSVSHPVRQTHQHAQLSDKPMISRTTMTTSLQSSQSPTQGETPPPHTYYPPSTTI